MKDKNTIQSYVNNFRRHLSIHLRPGIGLSCNIHPSKQEGAILEFLIGSNLSNEDLFNSPQESVNVVLKSIPQKMVGGNLDGIKFSGTNISMEQNRIIIIKGEDDPNLWSDKGAKTDVEKILNVYRGTGR